MNTKKRFDAVYPDKSLLAGFPDRIHLGEGLYSCSYVYDPGNPTDGVTVKIPVGAASTVPLGALDWLVPGLITEKIKTLVKGLPKPYRRRLGPVPQAIEKIVRKIPDERNQHRMICRQSRTRLCSQKSAHLPE